MKRDGSGDALITVMKSAHLLRLLSRRTPLSVSPTHTVTVRARETQRFHAIKTSSNSMTTADCSGDRPMDSRRDWDRVRCRAVGQLRFVGSTTEGGGTWDGERLTAGGPGGGDGSGRAPDVAVMQATDLGNRDDPAEFRPLNSSAVGRILVKRKVSTRPVIVREVASQGTAQGSFAKDEDVIQTFAPDGADKAPRERVLPWAARRRQNFTDAHALHALSEYVPVDRVGIAEEVGRRGVVREGVHDLLGGPVGSGVFGHVEVDDAAAMVNEHDENEEDAQARGGHREETQ